MRGTWWWGQESLWGSFNLIRQWGEHPGPSDVQGRVVRVAVTGLGVWEF